MQYSQLIARIQADIYNNGAELITGDILQGDLLAMVSALASSGAGYGGIITPGSSAPASLDQATFYIAIQPGTYSSFGVTVTEPSIVSYGGGATLTFTVSPLGLASAMIVNNLTTDDATKALSAAQGVVLNGKVTGVAIPVTESGKAIYLNGGIGATIPAPTNSSYSYSRYPVTPGDVVIVNGTGGSSPRLWGFIDSEEKIIAVADASVSASELVLIAPENSAAVIINTNNTSVPCRYIAKNYVLDIIERHNSYILPIIEELEDGTLTITKTEQIEDFQTNKYYRCDGATILGPVSLTGTSCILLEVNEGDKFRITGNSTSTTIALYATANSEKTIIRTLIGNHRATPAELTIESGEKYLAVNFYSYNSNTDYINKLEEYNTNQLYDSIKLLSDGIDSKIASSSRNWFWKGKNVVVFGDSISEFKSSLSGGYGWTDRFVELSESNVFNGAIGGSRISARRATILPVSASETATENSYRAYNSLDVVNLVKAWVANNWSVVDTNVAWLANNVSDNNTEQINHLKSVPVADADVVIISAGTNDWHNGSTDGADTLDNFNVQQIYGALNNIVKDILSANTKIQLYFLTPIPRYVSRGVPTFSTSEDYAVGDLVMYNNVGNVFISAHTAGAWDSSQVRAATDLDYRRDDCSSDVVQVDGRTLLTFAENEISFIHRHHLPVADMYKNIGFNKYNWSNYFPDYDNTHPYKGFIYLGERIYAIISAL